MAKERRPKKVTGLKDQLRKLIQESGQTLYALGKVTGIGKDRLYRFMSGERGIGLDAVEVLCEKLGLELVRRPDDPKGK
jgi:hypothetical protein